MIEGQPCRRCGTPVLRAHTMDGWRWVALHIRLPDPRRYACPSGEPHEP